MLRSQLALGIVGIGALLYAGGEALLAGHAADVSVARGQQCLGGQTCYKSTFNTCTYQYGCDYENCFLNGGVQQCLVDTALENWNYSYQDVTPDVPPYSGTPQQTFTSAAAIWCHEVRDCMANCQEVSPAIWKCRDNGQIDFDHSVTPRSPAGPFCE
jgi:hypothetical protein